MKTLYGYQKIALENILTRKKSLLALDMGLGKTFVAANWLNTIFNKTTIILAQKNKVKDWYDEVTCFINSNNVFIPNTTKDLSNLINTLDIEKYVIITTYNKFNNWLKENRKTLKSAHNFIDLIIDESQVLKSHTSQLSKNLLYTSKTYEYILLCAGDPLSCGYKDLFVQMKLLEAFDENYSFYHFKQDYCYTKHFYGSNIEIIVGYKNIDNLLNKLNDVSYLLKTEQAVDLPTQTHIEINVKNDKLFNRFLHDKVYFYDTNDCTKCIKADNTLLLMNYLKQISSGFIYIDPTNPIYLNDYKKEVLKELIDNNENFVIFYQYTAELKHIIEAANETKKNLILYDCETNYKNLPENNTIVVLQYQAGAKGVDGLQFNFNKTIYYSLTRSGELYKQSLKRTHRLNQTNKCFYYYLLTENSLDKKILNTLKKYKEYTLKLFMQDFCEW